MTTLSPVLSTADLPAAELQAARLDGELFALAGAWCPFDELEGPGHRARAVLAGRSARFIADLGTAAWVWDAGPLPATPAFAVTPDARARLPHAENARVREAVLPHEDIVDASGAGHRATSPARTAIDLARADEAFDAGTVTRLLAIAGVDVAGVLRMLDARPGIPGKKTARERLTRLLGGGQAVETR